MSRTGSSFIAISLSLLMLGGTVTTPALAGDEPQLNFKIYNPESSSSDSEPSDEAPSGMGDSTTGNHFSVPMNSEMQAETPSVDDTPPVTKTQTSSSDEASTPTASGTTDDASSKTETASETTGETTDSSGKKVLKGYVKVVPTGTKIPIIMDTAVDSDTSQEGDEFAARTSEDLSIDGSTIVPAGSIIKGRIAQLNSPKHLNRSGSVGLKFDTITTPDNRSIPIVANLVARGGVVHARRGLKDIAFDTGAVALPTLVGLGVGALAAGSGNNNNSSSSNNNNSISRAGGAMIGAGVGIAVGVAILLSKKGKKVEVRPGDELKIELAEELRMPNLSM
ncbi:hypothetical protein KF707_12835 [Candidatus Obscuribacterales bacterium]|nr:hypothetical protein [Candidatus Obscuribacterales bacterium]